MTKKYRTNQYYMLAHPDTSWGIDAHIRHGAGEKPHKEGFDLVAIKPNGVLVFRRRSWPIRLLRILSII
jgi:hypothetical protein